jgi:hypothetical protein
MRGLGGKIVGAARVINRNFVKKRISSHHH